MINLKEMYDNMLNGKILYPDNTWVTSDLHFDHKNIVEFTNRPIDIDKHTDWLYNQLNIVGDNDIVLHLGDFSFKHSKPHLKNIISKLKGHWFFVLGNHDNHKLLESVILEVNREFGKSHKLVGDYKVYKVLYDYDSLKNKPKFKKVVMCHFPFSSWDSSQHGSINLHGHTHGNSTNKNIKSPFVKGLYKFFDISMKKLPKVNQLDVGIDALPNHRPYTIKEVLDIINHNNKGRENISQHKNKIT